MLGNLPERLRIAQRDKRVISKFCQRYAFPIGIPVSLGTATHISSSYSRTAPAGTSSRDTAESSSRSLPSGVLLMRRSRLPYSAEKPASISLIRSAHDSAQMHRPPVRCRLSSISPRASRSASSIVRCVPQQDISLLGAAQSLSPFARITRLPARFPDSVWFWIQRLRHVQALGGARHIFVFGYGGKLPKLV